MDVTTFRRVTASSIAIVASTASITAGIAVLASIIAVSSFKATYSIITTINQTTTWCGVEIKHHLSAASGRWMGFCSKLAQTSCTVFWILYVV